MYPSSVVSNVKARRKNTHHDLLHKKYIYFKKKRLFSLPFHTPLIWPMCTTSSPVTARGLWLHSFFKQHLYFKKKEKKKKKLNLKNK